MNQLNKELTSIYDELPLWSAPFGLKLLEEIQLKRNIKALDIGFGTGFPMLELAQRLGESSVVYGIDPWNDAVDRTQLKIKSMELKNVRIFNGHAEQMPFRDGYFDLIISNNGLNNVNDLTAALKESFRVAKKNAPLIFTVNLPDTMITFYNIFEKVLNNHGLNHEIEKMHKHIQDKRKSVEELSQYLEDAGFLINKIDEDIFHLNFMDGSALFNHFFMKTAFLDSWEQIVSKRDMRKIFAELEEKLNLYARQQGSLNLTIPFACFNCIKK
jgi:ubiquinone/menaquinone biosynthesis C-methylase UbiE